MRHNLFNSFQRSNSMFWIFFQQSPNQRFDLFGNQKILGKVWFRVHNSIEYIFLFMCKEWGMPKQQFIKKYTKRIMIDLKTMPTSNLSSKVLGQHFRCHILRTTTVRISDVFFINLRFGKSKVGYFHISVLIKQYILEFHVSEQYFFRVKVIQALQDLTEYKFGLWFGYVLSLLNQLIQVAIRTILEPEDYIVFTFQSIAQINQSLMINSKQNILLILQHPILIFSNN